MKYSLAVFMIIIIIIITIITIIIIIIIVIIIIIDSVQQTLNEKLQFVTGQTNSLTKSVAAFSSLALVDETKNKHVVCRLFEGQTKILLAIKCKICKYNHKVISTLYPVQHMMYTTSLLRDL